MPEMMPETSEYGDDAFPSGALVCGDHPQTEATFQCSSCRALLCSRCVTMTGSLFVCERCGDRAEPLAPMAEEAEDAGPAPPLLDTAGQVSHHVVVPMAIIAMVASVLFFLVDVRSVFLPYGFALKWVGFCFVMATVLITRHAKLTADSGRQGCYTLFLAGATVMVIWASPWDPKGGLGGALVNTVIVLVVWRFATRLTASMGREGEPPERPKKRLYGVSRLELEEWKRENEGRPRLSKPQDEEAKKASKADAHGNPGAAVAKLVALVLVGIALAEPVLLKGLPSIAVRALVTVIVFLLASGTVLAAGSSIGLLRTVRRQGGKVSEGVVPLRLFVALTATVFALALALAVPGVTYRGRGEILPETSPVDHRGFIPDEAAEGSGSGENPGDQEGGEGGDASGDQGAEPGEGGKSADAQEQGSSASPEQTGPEQAAPQAATAFLELLAGLGKLLWIPFVLFLLVGGFILLRRLAPFLSAKLKGLSGWRQRLLALLAALARPRGGRRAAKKEIAPVDVSFLERLAPRDAVVRSYLHVLELFGALGYSRPERHTPYEFLQGLPRHLDRLREPLAGMTDLYVRAAYGGEELAEKDRRVAVQALVRVEKQAVG